MQSYWFYGAKIMISAELCKFSQQLFTHLFCWMQVKGMRDIISHHYFDIDPAQVLWIVTNEINPLKTAINHFIEELNK